MTVHDEYCSLIRMPLTSSANHVGNHDAANKEITALKEALASVQARVDQIQNAKTESK